MSDSDVATFYPGLAMMTFPNAGPPEAANDNLPDVVPMPRCEWDVYRAARRGRLIGRVAATDAAAALRIAAAAFDTDIKKLIAVRRPPAPVRQIR